MSLSWRSNQSDEHHARFDNTPAGFCLCLVAAAAHSQSPADSAYTEVFYPSGSLRIHAFLYKPNGDGPFPVVIYNHGSRTGRRAPGAERVYRQAADRGWVRGAVPERRGYGDSDGPTLAEASARLGAGVRCTD